MKIVLLLILSFALPVLADSEPAIVRTQIFYQPPAGWNDVQIEAKYNDQTTGFTFTGTTISSESKDYQYTLTLERSFTSTLSVGVDLNIGTSTQTTSSSIFNNTTHQVGLGDPQAYVKDLLPLGESSLLLSLVIDYSPQPNLNVDGQGTSNGNRFSGGYFVQPSVGFQGRVSPGNIVGLGASYQILSTVHQNYTSGAPSSTISGGNLLAINVFYELQAPHFALDLLGDIGAKDETLSSGGSTSSQDLNVGASAIVAYGATFTWLLLPERLHFLFGYFGYSAGQTAVKTFNTAPINVTSFSLAGRFLF